MKIKVCYYFI